MTRRRALAALSLTVLLAVVAVLGWKTTTLQGLPDIGDPFDVAAFTSARVADEDNAFVLYREAIAASVRPARADELAGLDWSALSEDDRRWLDANAPALEIWRRGTARPEARLIDPATITFNADLGSLTQNRQIGRMALLRGSRCETEGDVAGAWAWYRDALRFSRHLGRAGTIIERLVGVEVYRLATLRIEAWAARPDVDRRSLASALDEIRTIDAMTVPPSVVLRTEYLGFVHTVDRPELLRETLDVGGLNDESTWRGPRSIARRAWAALLREPERSKRVFRIILADWLAVCDLPASARPPTVGPLGLSHAGDVTHAGLTPEAVEREFLSTILLRQVFPAVQATIVAIDRERAAKAALIARLEAEIARRAGDSGSAQDGGQVVPP